MIDGKKKFSPEKRKLNCICHFGNVKGSTLCLKQRKKERKKVEMLPLILLVSKMEKQSRPALRTLGLSIS